MIRTESLTKFYGPRCAVRDLNLEIEAREIIGFLGLNGAGKTTALKMLAGILAPSYGHIEINGVDIHKANAHRTRWQIGFLPERPPLYEDMMVEDYLRFAAQLRGYPKNKLEKRVGEILELTGVTSYRREPITNLSHGYKQRVGIAQAIIHDPRLVILDEPTNGLDPVQIVEMRNLIQNLKNNHTVLLSSHNLPEISQTCDRLMVIKEGRLVARGAESDLSHKLTGAPRLRLELIGDKNAISTTLDRLQNEGLVSRWSSSDEGAFICAHVYPASTEYEKIAKAIINAGVGLRLLQPEVDELENLFLEFTKAPS